MLGASAEASSEPAAPLTVAAVPDAPAAEVALASEPARNPGASRGSKPAPTWSIAGQVEDQSDRGVPGLEIRLHRVVPDGTQRIETQASKTGSLPAELVGTATSGGDGRFRFGALGPGLYHVAIAPEQLRGPVFYAYGTGSRAAEQLVSLDNEHGPPGELSFRIFRRPSADELMSFLVGVVVDERGAPVEGAHVLARMIRANGFSTGDCDTIFDGSFAIGPVDGRKVGDWSVTAADTSLPENHTARSSCEPALPGQHLRLVLRPKARLVGDVLEPDDAPCARGTVTLRSLLPDAFATSSRGLSDPAENVESTEIRAGAFELLAWPGEYELFAHSDLGAGGATVDLTDRGEARADVELERCAVSFALPVLEPDLTIEVRRDGRPQQAWRCEPQSEEDTYSIGVAPGAIELVAFVVYRFGPRIEWRTAVVAVAGETVPAPAWSEAAEAGR